MNALLDRIIERYMVKHELDEEQIAYIKYGLEVIVTTVINILVIMLLALILNKPGYGFLFMMIFVPTRTFGGGYHSETRLRCNLLILCCEGISLLLPGFIEGQNIAAIVIASEWLLYYLIVLRYAPVENHNKPLTIEIRSRNKVNSRLLGIVWAMVLAIAFWWDIHVAITIATVLLFVAGLMVWGVQKEKRVDDSDCSM